MTAATAMPEWLHPGLRTRIEQRGWKGLSPIQERAAPVILAGRDCVLEAPTAGGKTEAVLFPLLSLAAAAPRSGVQLLYLAPLRALLNNLEIRATEYARDCGLVAFKWHGDVSQRAKLQAMREPPDLLLTTPESLEAILLRKTGWQDFFTNLRSVIIDEAHSFAFCDRGAHLACLLERLEHACGRPVQRVLASATVGDPKAVLAWLEGAVHAQPVAIRAEREPPRDDFEVTYFAPAAQDAPAEDAPEYRCMSQLQALLQGKRSIVFVRSRRQAETTAHALEVLARHCGRRAPRVRTHHSAVSRFFREEAEALIQAGSEAGIDAILSTSTLELGIDIGALDRVVQLDVISSPSSFLQRVGRTGRRPGQARSFRGLCVREDDLLLTVATVTLGSAGRSEVLRVPGRAYHILAHQLLCLALQQHGVRAGDAWRLLRGASCLRQVSEKDVGELVDHMLVREYLREVDGLLVCGDRAERELLGAGGRRMFAVFDTAPAYDVWQRGRHVGTLDAAFVEMLKPPFLFSLASRHWKATQVDAKGHRVEAQPAGDSRAPKWVSFGGPDIPFETAQAAGALVHSTCLPAFVDAAARTVLEELQRAHENSVWRRDAVVVDVQRPGRIALLTYAGDRINRTLARLLASADCGRAVSDFRRVTLETAPSETERAANAVGELLSPLRRRPDPQGLLVGLAAALDPYPFSPFARCLPPRLGSLALADQRLDCEGLCRLLKPA